MRDSEVSVFVGFNGTGKSSLIEEFVRVEVQKRKGRALIVCPDPFEWKQYPILDPKKPGAFANMRSPHRLIYSEGDIKLIADPYTGYFDGLLAFDDCRAYTKPYIQDALRTLIIRRRQRSHDIIAAGHGFTEIPPVFFTYANRYAIFYTQDNVEKRKEDIGAAFDMVCAAVRDVNCLYDKDPHSKIIIKARAIKR